MLSRMNQSVPQDILQRLTDAGAHFAHTKSRRHPSMQQYVIGNKARVDIIDLVKTHKQLNEATDFIEECAKKGKTPLFVGGKREVADIIADAATRLNAPYVSTRWLGGTISNFVEIKKRIALLTQLTNDRLSADYEKRNTKLERIYLDRKIDRLVRRLDGLVGLSKLPSVLIVVDTRHEKYAINEAKAAGIPIVGIQNTDCNLVDATYPIVANDASRATVTIILDELVHAFERGNVVNNTPAPTE